MPHERNGHKNEKGTSKGVSGSSKILDIDSLKKACTERLNQYRQSVLVEDFLPGREFTAGIVGTGKKASVIGAMEVVFKHDDAQGIYSYDSKFVNNGEWVEYKRVDENVFRALEKEALIVWRGLGCRDAGRIDFRMDAAARINFLEVNPMAGLNPTYGDLPIICGLYKISYGDLIKTIMASALERQDK